MSLERMPEANFGPEVQPTTPEAQVFRGSPNVVVSRGSMLDRITSAVVGKAHDVKDNLKPYVLHVVTATALLAAACSGGDQNNDIRIDTQTPTPTAEATLESPPSPTSEPTLAPSNGGGSDGKFPTPTATSTPEVKQEVPCLVVSTELCQTAELLEVEVGGSVLQVIGLKLPVNTEVFSFRGGMIFKSNLSDPLSGSSVVVGDAVPDKSKPSIDLMGDLLIVDKNSIEAGEVVATIQDTGKLNFGFNLIISVNTLSTDDPEAVLRGLFPDAFSQPVKKVTLDQAKNSSPTYSGSSVIPK